MSRPWIQGHQMDRNVSVGLTKPHKPLKSNHSTYDGMRKVKLRHGYFDDCSPGVTYHGQRSLQLVRQTAHHLVTQGLGNAIHHADAVVAHRQFDRVHGLNEADTDRTGATSGECVLHRVG